MSSGRIRDYQGGMNVLENQMKFAVPARYIQLDPLRIPNQADKSEAYMRWDLCVLEASEIFRSERRTLYSYLLIIYLLFIFKKTAIVNKIFSMIVVYTLYQCL